MRGQVTVKISSQILAIDGMIDEESQKLHSEKYRHIGVKAISPADDYLLSWKTRIILTGFHGLRISHHLCQYCLHWASV